MSRHTLTAASDISYGDAYYVPGYSRRGVPITPIYKQTFSSAIAALDVNALCTNQALITAGSTFTFATAVVGLTTDASSQRVLDHARNITITTSDLGATATVIVKGEDVYGASMWERFLVTASDATVSGTKAFKKVSKVIPSGATGIAKVGFGNRLGLDYKVSSLHDIIKGQEGDQGIAATDITVDSFRLPTYSATEVHSATSEGTASALKDVRGTWKPLAVIPDGAVTHSLWYKISGVRSKFGAYGINQTAS